MYNGHRDVVALINEAGQIEATYYYDAFGNIEEETGNKNNKILYRGYEYDKETGLYYLNARHYDPRVARFMQEDTYTGDINDPLSLNLYTYVHNNPLRYTDPTGHWVEGDENLSLAAQERIRELTFEWHAAKTQADKDRIHLEAQGIREAEKKTNNGGNAKKSTDKVKNDQGTYYNDKDFNNLILHIKEKSRIPNKNSYDPKNWERELQSRITPLIDLIPANISESQRIYLIDNIIISEAQKLQDKYRTAYSASEQSLFGFLPKSELNKALSPLYEEFGKRDSEPDSNTTAFVKGFLNGFSLGIMQGTTKWGNEDSNKVNESVRNKVEKLSSDDLRKVGVPSENSGIRALTGNADDAFNFFKSQVNPNTIKEVKPGTFVGRDSNGLTFTYRASSKSGPPTIDVNGVSGLRKIKFIDRSERK